MQTYDKRVVQDTERISPETQTKNMTSCISDDNANVNMKKALMSNNERKNRSYVHSFTTCRYFTRKHMYLSNCFTMSLQSDPPL